MSTQVSVGQAGERLGDERATDGILVDDLVFHVQSRTTL
jgi:hypothetical protein